MRILFVTQWYKPIQAPVKRMVRIAECLAHAGHEVTVLTGMPSYPTGILPPKYRGKLWTKEKDGQVEIIRTYEYPTANQGVFKRLINNISFAFSASIASLILPPADIVIVSSPSFLSGIAGLLATNLKKGDFIFDVRDLWPDSAAALGLMKKDRRLFRILKLLEKYYYQKAKKILVTTEKIKKQLISENVPAAKIVTLLNSADTTLFRPMTVSRKNFGFEKKDFIITFVGNHSRAYDLYTVIESAKILQKYSEIKFLFVGEGEEKNNLVREVAKKKIQNVIFLPGQNTPTIIKILNFSDVTLISLINIKNFQEAIPAKTSEYAACGKPIIASIGGGLKKYLEDYQAGLIYPAGNARALAKEILKLYHQPKLKQKMGENARRLALDIFSDRIFAKKLKDCFKF